MKMTENGLKLLQDIERFFYFKMKFGEERPIASMVKERNRKAFIAFVKQFQNTGRGFLGGFTISLSNDETIIKKIPFPNIEINETIDGNFVADVERYKKNKDGYHLTMIETYKHCLEYGNG